MTRTQPLVLLVDNEDTFLEIISMHLAKKGVVTAFARSADEGLRQAELLQPDLALSDILMPPGPNGFEFAFALRSNPKTHHIKLAFFTSLCDPWHELAYDRNAIATKLGEVAFFDKCDDIEHIGDHVLSLLK